MCVYTASRDTSAYRLHSSSHGCTQHTNKHTNTMLHINSAVTIKSE